MDRIHWTISSEYAVAPQDLLRVDPDLTDNQVGGQQVKELAARNAKPKVVVDAHFGESAHRISYHSRGS